MRTPKQLPNLGSHRPSSGQSLVLSWYGSPAHPPLPPLIWFDAATQGLIDIYSSTAHCSASASNTSFYLPSHSFLRCTDPPASVNKHTTTKHRGVCILWHKCCIVNIQHLKRWRRCVSLICFSFEYWWWLPENSASCGLLTSNSQ